MVTHKSASKYSDKPCSTFEKHEMNIIPIGKMFTDFKRTLRFRKKTLSYKYLKLN